MTNKETNKIQKHKDYVTCYQLHIDELKQRKKYFYDDLPIDKYEAGLSYLINNHSIPEREATRLAMLTEAETDTQLERYEDMLKMLYSDFADAVNTPSITIEKKPEKTIDEFLDEILEKKKHQAKRLFKNKNRMIVEEFEKEMIHLKMVKGEMKIVSAKKKEQS